MNQKTLKITLGAMFVAIFAMILLVNRQTGNLLEEFIFYLLPIPMVAYAAKYGWKSSLPVWVSMSLISLLFGTITTVFYAVTEAGIGLIFGTCVYKKIDSAKTMFTVMGLSAIVNVLNTIVLASLFGYDLKGQISELQSMMTTLFQNSNIQMAESIQEMLLDSSFLLRLLVISMVIMGLVQGFLIYQLSLLLLRRLRYPMPAPRSMYTIYPWKWTGLLAAAAYVGCDYVLVNPAENERIQAVLTTAGTIGCFYLLFFGILMVLLFSKKCIARSGIVGILLVLACYIFNSLLLLIFGLLYVVTGYHKRLMEMPDKA